MLILPPSDSANAFDMVLHASSVVISPQGLTDVDEHMRAVFAEARSEVARFTYPLYAMDSRGRPDLFASAVVVECEGMPILVTAAHAVHAIERTESAVHLGGNGILPIEASFIRSSPQGADSLDLAAMVLPHGGIDPEKKSVLPEARTTIGKAFEREHFSCVYGFPCNKNKQHRRLDPSARTFASYGFTYFGLSRNVGADYARPCKDPDLHGVLEYEKSARDEAGQKATPSHPRGMSGGGVWLVPDASAPRNAYLDGIAIEYYQGEALVLLTRVEDTP